MQTNERARDNNLIAMNIGESLTVYKINNYNCVEEIPATKQPHHTIYV